MTPTAAAALAVVALGPIAMHGPVHAEPAVAIVDCSDPPSPAAVRAVTVDATAAGLDVPSQTVASEALVGELPAARSVADAGELLDRGEEAYRGFQYKRAAGLVASSERILLAIEPSSEAVAALARSRLLSAQISQAGGRRKRAMAALRTARHLAPDLQISDRDYKPELVERFGRAAPGSQPLVKVAITTAPAGARVWIDGQLAGISPVTVELETGEHMLTAARRGHSTTGRRWRASSESDSATLKLPALDDARSVQQLRRDLAEQVEASSAWQLGASRIGELMGTGFVVFVRSGQSGPRAAIYAVAPGDAAVWHPVPSTSLSSALAALGEAGGVQVVGSNVHEKDTSVWPAVFIGTGAAVLAAAAVLIVLDSSDTARQYTLGPLRVR